MHTIPQFSVQRYDYFLTCANLFALFRIFAPVFLVFWTRRLRLFCRILSGALICTLVTFLRPFGDSAIGGLGLRCPRSARGRFALASVSSSISPESNSGLSKDPPRPLRAQGGCSPWLCPGVALVWLLHPVVIFWGLLRRLCSFCRILSGIFFSFFVFQGDNIARSHSAFTLLSTPRRYSGEPDYVPDTELQLRLSVHSVQIKSGHFFSKNPHLFAYVIFLL